MVLQQAVLFLKAAPIAADEFAYVKFLMSMGAAWAQDCDNPFNAMERSHALGRYFHPACEHCVEPIAGRASARCQRRYRSDAARAFLSSAFSSVGETVIATGVTHGTKRQTRGA